jgi:nucleoside phosphorylase
MSRYSDIVVETPTFDPTPLPVVDWRRIGSSAPKRAEFTYSGPEQRLPKADAVVITWTSAEWSALDHVFLNSNGTRLPTARQWEAGWHLYTRNAPPMPPAPAPAPAATALTTPAVTTTEVTAAAPTPPPPPPPLWGYYALVEIARRNGSALKLLLFKSNSHLAHAPGLSGLVQIVSQIIEDVSPQWIYSIGTAGGTREDQRLGDVVITDSATIRLENPINSGSFAWNGQTYTSAWFPSMALMGEAQQQLFFPMSAAVSYPALQLLVTKMHAQVPGTDAIGLDDLVNPQVRPGELHTPRNHALRGVPLLTTDFYFIAKGSSADKYAFLEMDDAVIAKIAGDRAVKYAFVRNISDPIVPSATNAGEPLSDPVRSRWSGLIYETYGLYSSFNGAVATWATLAQID